MEFKDFRKLSNQLIGKIVTSNRNAELNTELLEKLLRKVRVEPEKNCWLTKEDWTNYAMFQKVLAHRWIYRVMKGPVQSDNFICHKCDRPGCINPDHLFQGTNKDNRNDAIKKNRRFPLVHKGGWHFKKWKEQDRIRQLDRFVGENKDGNWDRFRR